MNLKKNTIAMIALAVMAIGISAASACTGVSNHLRKTKQRSLVEHLSLVSSWIQLL